jgi:DNA-binding NtrC family response regulator
MGRPAIFVFEPHALLEERIGKPLLGAGYSVIEVRSADQLLRGLRARHGRAVLLGPTLSMDMQQVLGLVQTIRDTGVFIPVILTVANSSEDYAIAALRAGVNEYIRYPFDIEEIAAAVERALRLPEGGVLRTKSVAPVARRIVGQSLVMREIHSRVERLAASESNVLITGERETGKELFAALVHGQSRRRDKAFVAINCAAIPDSLLESELFGYAKGAFTGADTAQDGKVRAADQGTLFLDEIGDMSLYSQAKILRVLENREIQRLGCSQGVPVNLRVVAATNQDLDQLSRENRFRRDLFFRLNVARIHLPPLRERKEDLAELVDHYLEFCSRQLQRGVPQFSDEALECMFAYDWPGNVRELRNVVESILAESQQDKIEARDLPPQFRCGGQKLPPDERGRLLWALTATNWNKSKAAAKLQWSRMTLYRKMDRYNILREPATAGTGEAPNFC